ncbi:hypothetical protein M2H02_22255, partial [Vibrio vulnificus]|nr:hypothetical protein [Vibrio vulnificus]MCU8234381.1 hypothetical protein [Vibrio vulnificus]MCU8575724.1 hypothetical protein [Vibrio vulnificus]
MVKLLCSHLCIACQ